MCGINGLYCYGDKGAWMSELKIAADLLYVGALRGTHGTGLFAIGHNGSRIQIKIGGPPDQLFGAKSYRDFENFADKKDIKVLIGHNRYATTGGHTTDNAHPFRHGSITMVHNGTIDSFGKFKKEAKKFVVDSEAMCFLIDKYGIQEVVRNVTGAWAIVAWDEKTSELHIFKNKERPLYLCHRGLANVWYLASEKEMLDWVLNRHYVNPIPSIMVKNDVLYTFKDGAATPIETKLETLFDYSKRLYEEYTDKENKEYAQRFTRTTSEASTDAHIVAGVPYAKKPFEYPLPLVSSSAGEWLPQRGDQKTGKVSVPKPAAANLRESWVVVTGLKDLAVGKALELEISDYEKVKDTNQGFELVLISEKYPDIRFMAHITGDAFMEKLVEAESVTAEILNIQKSNNSPTLSRHRIIVKDPIPTFIIPEHAFDENGIDPEKGEERAG